MLRSRVLEPVVTCYNCESNTGDCFSGSCRGAYCLYGNLLIIYYFHTQHHCVKKLLKSLHLFRKADKTINRSHLCEKRMFQQSLCGISRLEHFEIYQFLWEKVFIATNNNTIHIYYLRMIHKWMLQIDKWRQLWVECVQQWK